MKAREMREKTPEELRHLLEGWRGELFTLGVQSMTGQMEQYGRMGRIRKDIARVLTILREQRAPAAAPRKENEVS